MRWTCGILITLAVGGALGGCALTSTGAASCAEHEIDVADAALHPGGSVGLSVDFMTERCEDTGGTNVPAKDIAVTITPSSTGTPIDLGRMDAEAGDGFTASGTFDLPADLPTGEATLRVASPTDDEAEASRTVTVSAAG